MGLMKKFQLDGKKAIVTGGAKGLSYDMAQALHEAGAEVVLFDLLDLVEESAKRLGASGAPAYAVKGNLTLAGDRERMLEEALEKLGGRIDILLNGAGVQFRCPAEDFPAEQWTRVLSVNLDATFYMCQQVGRVMLQQGSGSILNIASMCSFFGSERIPAYSASKGGVMQLTKALSNEWSGRGVRVNAIAPGYMQTQLTADMKEKNPAQYREITGRIPMGRWGQPEDLQGVAVFLASEASAYVSGAIIPVDGGYLGK